MVLAFCNLDLCHSLLVLQNTLDTDCILFDEKQSNVRFLVFVCSLFVCLFVCFLFGWFFFSQIVIPGADEKVYDNDTV